MTEAHFYLALVALSIAISVACNGLGLGRRMVVTILAVAFLAIGLFRGREIAFGAIQEAIESAVEEQDNLREGRTNTPAAPVTKPRLVL